jgi:hypothetical protein
MPRVGFEPRIQVYERAKIFNALDRVATAIGPFKLFCDKIQRIGVSGRKSLR